MRHAAHVHFLRLGPGVDEHLHSVVAGDGDSRCLRVHDLEAKAVEVFQPQRVGCGQACVLVYRVPAAEFPYNVSILPQRCSPPTTLQPPTTFQLSHIAPTYGALHSQRRPGGVDQVDVKGSLRVAKVGSALGRLARVLGPPVQEAVHLVHLGLKERGGRCEHLLDVSEANGCLSSDAARGVKR